MNEQLAFDLGRLSVGLATSHPVPDGGGGPTLKRCPHCKQNKPRTEYYKDKSEKDGLRAYCKPCSRYLKNEWLKRRGFAKKRKSEREWRKANSERMRLIRKKEYKKHRGKYLEYSRKHRKEHRSRDREYYRDYHRKKKKCDIQYRLRKGIRTRARDAVGRGVKAGSAVKDLGCSIEELKAHLEAQFKPGMTWGNWSYEGWHIDHIKPLASFDLTDRKQFLQACHYTNLQPLWAEENMKKGDRGEGN